MSKTYLSKKDVKQALQVAQLMSSYDQIVDILFAELTEIITFNQDTEREKDVTEWIERHRREEAKEDAERKAYNDKLKAREDAGEYVDINEYRFASPPPNAHIYRGVTICGWCLRREEEGEPEEGCYKHYFKKKKKGTK